MSARSETQQRPLPSGAILGLALTLLLTIFAVAPLTYPGFFQARSGFLPAFDAVHLDAAPSWSGLANAHPAGGLQGEGKLPYLLVQPFLALSDSGVIAIKWGYGLAFLLGAAGVYAWARRWLGNGGGVLVAAVYAYLPWHLSAVYIRGAYAEAWLWAIWPYLLWAVDRLASGHRAGTLVALIIGGALVAASFWTQVGLTVLFLPLLFVYGLLTHVPRGAASRRLRGKAWPWLAGGLLVLVPILVLVALQAAKGGADSYSSQFLYPSQLFVDSRGEGLSFQLGTVAVGLSIVALTLAASERDSAPSRTSGLRRLLWFFGAALLVITGLTLPLSAPLWRVTGLEEFTGQPWQVLALTGLPLAFLAGANVRLAPRMADLPALTGLLALVILASYPLLAPDFTAVDPGPEPVAAFHTLTLDQPSSDATAPQVLLLDYAIRPPTELTPTLTLTLTWQAVALPQQALAPVDADYTVFVHVLNRQGEGVAQRDSQPCDGECPTSGWRPGQILLDRHTLDLPRGAAPGPYRLAAGLYLVESGDRAAVVGRDDGTVYFDVP